MELIRVANTSFYNVIWDKDMYRVVKCTDLLNFKFMYDHKFSICKYNDNIMIVL